MTTTHTENVPPEVAEILESFRKIAVGREVDHVLCAASEMVAHTIVVIGSLLNWPKGKAEGLAEHVSEQIVESVAYNWKREDQSGDIPVRKPS